MAGCKKERLYHRTIYSLFWCFVFPPVVLVVRLSSGMNNGFQQFESKTRACVCIHVPI